MTLVINKLISSLYIIKSVIQLFLITWLIISRMQLLNKIGFVKGAKEIQLTFAFIPKSIQGSLFVCSYWYRVDKFLT